MSARIKSFLKDLFYRAGATAILDKLLFTLSRAKNHRMNSKYRRAHPSELIPPDYTLYETFTLDYQQFIDDGLLSARELLDIFLRHHAAPPERVLDWGCGVARVVRHLGGILPPGTNLSACDINAEMIEWDRNHIPGVTFSTLGDEPRTNYPDNDFDFVYAVSVLTHIDAQTHAEWFKEIHRIMKGSGIFIFSTHGSRYNHQLTLREKKSLSHNGAFTKTSWKKGHRLTTTYNSEESVHRSCGANFAVLAFYAGSDHPEKMGGQDLWVVQKISS